MADAASHSSPQTPETCYLEGLSHKKQQDYAAAIACFQQSLKQQPNHTGACFALACLLEETGALMPAIEQYKKLLSIQPDHKQGQKRFKRLAENMNKMNPHYQQGIALFSQQQWQQAADSFEKARNILPDVPEVLSNLALCKQQLGDVDKAYYLIQRAITLRPDYAEALNILGNLEQQRANPQAAQEAYEKAVQAQPNYLTALNNLGKIQQQLKDDGAAIDSYNKSLALQPEQADIAAALHTRLQSVHRWQESAVVKTSLEKLLQKPSQSASPFSLLQLDDPTLQLQNARKHAARHWPQARPYDATRPLPSANQKKWKIGYLSSDFHQHATAYLIAELFEQHDGAQFEIHAYSAGPDTECDPRRRIQQAAHAFHDISTMQAAEAAEKITADGIDILVDLKGHTHNHRLDIVAQRPAPLQMHYLGYPGTTGLPAIDYFIGDSTTLPDGYEEVFSEKLIRLPGSYQINDRQRPLPDDTVSRADYNLPDSGLVFCDFNQSYKITAEIFAVWMRLLQAVEGSVLWLLEYSDEATKHLRSQASEHGVDPARIIMAAHAPLAEHMNRTQHADLVLDTFPICSHTTASDALWCGVPVVTLAGKSFASRVAASLLQAVGLPELVVHTKENYEKLAWQLALDSNRLNRIKSHLREGRMQHPLFDSAATTRALEAAYLQAIALHTNHKA